MKEVLYYVLDKQGDSITEDTRRVADYEVGIADEHTRLIDAQNMLGQVGK